jgi:hypothetical protein
MMGVNAAVGSVKVRCAVCVEVPGGSACVVRGLVYMLGGCGVWAEADALTYWLLTWGHWHAGPWPMRRRWGSMSGEPHQHWRVGPPSSVC